MRALYWEIMSRTQFPLRSSCIGSGQPLWRDTCFPILWSPCFSDYSGVYRDTLPCWKPCKKRMIEAGPIAEWFQVLEIWHFSKPIPQNDQINPSNSPQSPAKLRHPWILSPNPTNLVSTTLQISSNQSYLRIKPSLSFLSSVHVCAMNPAPGSDAKDRTEALSGTSASASASSPHGLRRLRRLRDASFYYCIIIDGFAQNISECYINILVCCQGRVGQGPLGNKIKWRYPRTMSK